jgi:hypothetical protein
MTRALQVGLVCCLLSACSQPPVARLDDREAALTASAMSALLASPSFAGSPEAATGFCLGLRRPPVSEPMDPTPGLLSQVSGGAVPLFAYSECEPRPTPGWGDVRHAPSGKMVGLIVLEPVVVDAAGVARVSLRVDGGAFAAAGFECTVPPGAAASCSLSWIS